MGSLECASSSFESSGSFGFAWVHFGAPRGRRGSRGFTSPLIEVVRFFRVCVGSLGSAMASLVSFKFACVHSCASWGHQVLSSSRGFTRGRLWIFGFAWLYSVAPRCRLGHLGSRSFTRARLGVMVFVRVRDRLRIVGFIWGGEGSLMPT